MRCRFLAAATAIAALAVPTAAQAHVTLSPSEVPAGAFQVLDVRVPNERDDAATVKVQVQMPPGVVGVSYAAIPGWTTKVAKATLDKPIQTPDGPITEAVSTVTWTGTGKGEGAIAPGQFADFPISLQIPGRAGDVLTFAAGLHVRVVKVIAGGARRGPATEARTLYEDLTPEKIVEPAADAAAAREKGAGRPTKKDRRAIDRLRDSE